MTTIQVSSVLPAATAAGFVNVIARTKESKTRKVETANRLRVIQIPELEVTGLPSKFEEFVKNSLYVVAKQQLSELWKQNGNSWTETDDALFTVDALLIYAARESESKRLTTETLTDLFTPFVARFEEAKRSKMLASLVSIAAPKKSLNMMQCAFMLREIPAWQEELATANEDDDSWEPNPVIDAVVRKIQAHYDELLEMTRATDEAF